MPAPRVYFPTPFTILSTRRHWQRRQIREFIHRAAGLPSPEPRVDDEHLVGIAEVRQMLGGVSDMWISRRLRPEDRKPQGSALRKARGAQVVA